MMQRILVPLDGSPLAEHALAVAAKLARSTDGMLILVQSLTLPAAFESPLTPQVAPLALDEQVRRAQAYLTERVDRPMLSGLSCVGLITPDWILWGAQLARRSVRGL
jgi:nucleotide-binding universal stress UspA family protein